MNFFNNKLSRINFLILVLILPYLYTDMSNRKNSTGIAAAALSVVNINASAKQSTRNFWDNSKEAVIGSGILISDDGYIVTNLHVVAGRKNINVELDDGQIKNAKLSHIFALTPSHFPTFSPTVFKWL